MIQKAKIWLLLNLMSLFLLTTFTGGYQDSQSHRIYMFSSFALNLLDSSLLTFLKQKYSIRLLTPIYPVVLLPYQIPGSHTPLASNCHSGSVQ